MPPTEINGSFFFFAETRVRSTKDGMSYGSLIDCESRKIKKDCALHYYARIVFFHEVF